MYWGSAVTDWVLRLVVECNESEGFLLPSVTYGDDEGEKIVQNDLLLLSEDQVF
jgi:senataxin